MALPGIRSANLKNIPFGDRYLLRMNIKTSGIRGCLHALCVLPISQQHSDRKACLCSTRKVQDFQFASKASPVFENSHTNIAFHRGRLWQSIRLANQPKGGGEQSSVDWIFVYKVYQCERMFQKSHTTPSLCRRECAHLTVTLTVSFRTYSLPQILLLHMGSRVWKSSGSFCPGDSRMKVRSAFSGVRT